MSLLLTAHQEALRLYPAAVTLFRQPTKDDVLPLSKPIVTTSGETLTALPIPKGLRILTSVSAYNRYFPLWCGVAEKKTYLWPFAKKPRRIWGGFSHL